METLPINCHLGHAMLNVDIAGKMFNVLSVSKLGAAAAASKVVSYKQEQVKNVVCDS